MIFIKEETGNSPKNLNESPSRNLVEGSCVCISTHTVVSGCLPGTAQSFLPPFLSQAIGVFTRDRP